MPTAEDTLADFMMNKNKQDLGESIIVEKNNNDNNLPTKEKAKYYDTEMNNKDSDRAAAAAKQAMSILMMVPILVGGIGAFAYIIITIFPSIFNFIKSLLFILMF